MAKVLDIRVDHGEFLRNAVSVVSEIADRVMVYINDKGLFFLVRNQENPQGLLIVVLCLRKTGCSRFHFRLRVPNAYVGISLARFQEILNNVTQQDSVSISYDGYGIVLDVDVHNRVTGQHQNFPLQVIPSNAEEYPYNAPRGYIDETCFRVTASVPSELFRQVLTELRYDRGSDNVLKDTLTPVEIFLDKNIMVCESNTKAKPFTLQEEDGLTIEGATENDLLHLTFPLVQLNAFMKATQLSDRVFIHAHNNRGQDLPLLNCPFGQDHLGSLFFIGSYKYNFAEM